jgi:hypothetical protein
MYATLSSIPHYHSTRAIAIIALLRIRLRQRKVPARIIIAEHVAKREIQQNGNTESTLNNIVRSYNLPLHPGDPPWEKLYQWCA